MKSKAMPWVLVLLNVILAEVAPFVVFLSLLYLSDFSVLLLVGLMLEAIMAVTFIGIIIARRRMIGESRPTAGMSIHAKVCVGIIAALVVLAYATGVRL